jgi:hypothetical protein
VAVRGQYSGEPHDARRAERIWGDKAVRMGLQVRVQLPRRPRPINAGFGQKLVHHLGRDGWDVVHQSLAEPLLRRDGSLLRSCGHVDE